MEIDEEIDNLIRVTVNVFEAYTAVLFKAENNALSLLTSHSFSRQVRKRHRIEFGHGFIGWVAGSGKTLSASKFRDDTQELTYYKKEENIKSFIAAPALYRREVLGVLCVDSKAQFKFTEKEQKILENLAGQFALILKRQQEKEKERAPAEITRKVIEVCHGLNGLREEELLNGAVKLTRELVEADGCILALAGNRPGALEVKRAEGLTDSDTFLRSFSAAEGLVGLMMKEQKPLLVSNDKRERRTFQLLSPDEPRQKISSFIGVPLTDGDRFLGVLGCTRKKGKTNFSYNDLSLVKIIGRQAALRWSNIMLRKRLALGKTSDSLSGWLNHGSFLQQIGIEIDRANIETFSLILINLDKLSSINRRYGYFFGDRLIGEVARFIEPFLKEKDTRARFSGKRLALLLPEVSRRAALKLAEEIRTRAEQHIFVIKPYEIKTTLSLVATTYSDPAGTRDELLSALQAEAGKNNSVSYATGTGFQPEEKLKHQVFEQSRVI
ncbi:MAG: GAF domain-containing protein [bacterium]